MAFLWTVLLLWCSRCALGSTHTHRQDFGPPQKPTCRTWCVGSVCDLLPTAQCHTCSGRLLQPLLPAANSNAGNLFSTQSGHVLRKGSSLAKVLKKKKVPKLIHCGLLEGRSSKNSSKKHCIKNEVVNSVFHGKKWKTVENRKAFFPRRTDHFL